VEAIMPVAIPIEPWWRRLWWCAPLVAGGALLAWLGHAASRATDLTQCFPGRPLRIHDIGQTPEPLPAVERAVDDRPRRLSRLWLNDALAEQASIAAFGQLGLQLLRWGAPRELLTSVYEAAADEIVHARLCFSLASQYGQTTLDAAPFPAATEIDPRSTLAQLFDASIFDGALLEGFAGSALSFAARRSRDAAVSAVLERLAVDEARHAALGWEIARWALRVEPGLRGRLPALDERLTRARLDVSVYPKDLLDDGRIDPENARAIFESTRLDVIARLRQPGRAQ
jgi:hypothetical protein